MRILPIMVGSCVLLISAVFIALGISLREAPEPTTAQLILAGASVCLGVLAALLLHRLQTLEKSTVACVQQLNSIIRGDLSAKVTGPRVAAAHRELSLHIDEIVSLLDESLKTRDSMADIDHLILSGVKLNGVIFKSLTAAKLDALTACLLLRSETTSVQVKLHTLNGNKRVEKIVSQLDMSGKSLGDLRTYRKMAEGLSREPLIECYPIECDRTPVGALYVTGHRQMTASEAKRLSDLADRLSVAITNIDRADNLYRQANYDSLTGLLNRRAFEDSLRDRLVKLSEGEKGFVLFIDLDGFKKVNDTEGHEAGDLLLVGVAERLRSALGKSHLIARLGGDEFGVIGSGEIRPEAIAEFCEQAIEAITQPMIVGHREQSVGASIGVALYPENGETLDELTTKADSAMYHAKKTNGSCFAFFNEGLQEESKRKVAVEQQLRKAIKRRTLEVFFQPKLNIGGTCVDSAEALLRWQDATLGDVSPTEFISVAEDTGLIHDILPLVIDGIAGLLQEWQSNRLPLRSIALNVSPKQLMRDGFALSLLSLLDTKQIKHELIEVEVTETVFANDMVQVLTEVHILRMAGIKIALDDFGTGYSSLNMLRQLPLDVVKIDRSFISEIESSKEARDMVSHLVDIASSLGLEVVAEGVETEEQLRLLVKTGCQHIQGWFIGRAMPMEAFLSFVRSYNPSSLKGTPTVIDLASQIPDRASTRASGTLRSLR